MAEKIFYERKDWLWIFIGLLVLSTSLTVSGGLANDLLVWSFIIQTSLAGGCFLVWLMTEKKCKIVGKYKIVYQREPDDKWEEVKG